MTFYHIKAESNKRELPLKKRCDGLMNWTSARREQSSAVSVRVLITNPN